MQKKTFVWALSIAAAVGSASGGILACTSSENGSFADRFEHLREHRLLTIAEARGFEEFEEVVPSERDTAETRQLIDSGRASLIESEFERPVKLENGEIWTPEGFQLPGDCDQLYEVNPADPGALAREDERFERCLVEPMLLDFDSHEHQHLIEHYLRISLTAADHNDGELAHTEAPESPEQQWHCGGVTRTYYQSCTAGYWVPQTRTETIEGCIEGGVGYDADSGVSGSVSGGACTRIVTTMVWMEVPGAKLCEVSTYHPFICGSQDADSWGVCYCREDPTPRCGVCQPSTAVPAPPSN